MTTIRFCQTCNVRTFHYIITSGAFKVYVCFGCHKRRTLEELERD